MNDEERLTSAKALLEYGLDNADVVCVIKAIKSVYVSELVAFTLSLSTTHRMLLDSFLAEEILALTVVRKISTFSPHTAPSIVERQVNEDVVKQAKFLGFAYPEKHEVPL